MHQRALVLALMAAGSVLPGTTQAADDCSQMFVYSVNQFCRTLSNGFSQCQPVGMVGPAPNCAKPGLPPIMPVPLVPHVLQAPAPFNYMAPFPAPGGVAPAAAVRPMPAPAVAAAVPVPAPVAVLPPAPAAAPVPTPAVAAKPAPVVAVTPTPKQEPVVAPIAAPVPVASAPVASVPAKVDVASPVVVAAPAAAPVSPAVVVAPPVAVATPAQPMLVAAAPAAPAMPPSITLQDGLAHFGFDRAELSGPSRAELDAWLKQSLPKGKTLRVTGHADRIGPAAYNQKLSGRRAESVKKYLVGKGVAGQDIKVVAKGETEPVKHCKGGAAKATIDCLAPNRRVEIDPE